MEQMQNTFCHVDIPVSDMTKAGKFYEQVFGWQVKSTADPGYALIPGGGLRKKETDAPDSTINYICVDNLEQSLARVREAGGQVLINKEPAGDGYCAVFRDPEGNVLGLYTRR